MCDGLCFFFFFSLFLSIFDVVVVFLSFHIKSNSTQQALFTLEESRNSIGSFLECRLFFTVHERTKAPSSSSFVHTDFSSYFSRPSGKEKERRDDTMFSKMCYVDTRGDVVNCALSLSHLLLPFFDQASRI